MGVGMKHSSPQHGISAQALIVAFTAFLFGLPAAAKRCRCASPKVLVLLPLGALTALALLSFVADPAYGIALEFEPPGTQLDGDEILDIAVTGGRLTFNVTYNGGKTATSGAASNPLTRIRYEVNFDPKELRFKAIEWGDGGFAINLVNANQNTGFIMIEHGQGSVAAGVSTLLDEITFTILEPFNDGKKDFSFGAATTNNLGVPGGGALNTAQEVEVQPVPEPSALLLVSTLLVGVVVLGRKALHRRRF